MPSKIVNSTIGLDKVLTLILDVATQSIAADRGTLYLIDSSADELWSKVAQGNNMVEIRLPLRKGLAGYVAKTGETINIADAYKDPRFNPEIDRKSGYTTHTVLCMPMRDKEGQIVGAFQFLNKKEGPFTPDDEAFIDALSVHAAIALENARIAKGMVESERLSAVGRMASTIVHDIKNPMGTLRMYAQVIKKTGRGRLSRSGRRLMACASAPASASASLPSTSRSSAALAPVRPVWRRRWSLRLRPPRGGQLAIQALEVDTRRQVEVQRRQAIAGDRVPQRRGNRIDEAALDPGGGEHTFALQRVLRADQILLLCRSVRADFAMKIFNADGSVVEMCGNGIRCLARYIWDRRLSGKAVLDIETRATEKKQGGQIDLTQYAQGGEKGGGKETFLIGLLKDLKQTVDGWLKSINEEIEAEDVTRFKVRFLEILRSILEWVKEKIDSWLETSEKDMREKGGPLREIHQKPSASSELG